MFQDVQRQFQAVSLGIELGVAPGVGIEGNRWRLRWVRVAEHVVHDGLDEDEEEEQA